eukprot:c26161_g1_i1 orf=323-1264(-)
MAARELEEDAAQQEQQWQLGKAGKDFEEQLHQGEKEGEESDEDQAKLRRYESLRRQRIQENSAKLASLNLLSSVPPQQQPPRQQRLSERPDSSSHRRSARLKSGFPFRPQNDSDVDSDNHHTFKTPRGGSPGCDEEDEDCEYRPSDDGSGSESRDSSENENVVKALALSLGVPMEDAIPVPVDNSNSVGLNKGKRVRNAFTDISDNPRSDKSKRALSLLNTDIGRKKLKKVWKEVVKLTEDEIKTLFSIIGGGNSTFSVQELEYVASNHGFNWTREEIFDMIDVFDSDTDGQLNLSEFQGIAFHCNIIKSSSY